MRQSCSAYPPIGGQRTTFSANFVASRTAKRLLYYTRSYRFEAINLIANDRFLKRCENRIFLIIA